MSAIEMPPPKSALNLIAPADGVIPPTSTAQFDPDAVEGLGGLTMFGDLTLEPPKWIIEDILQEDSLALIFGQRKNGKTFVAADMACHIATGIEYHGHQVKRGLVVYILGEGRRGAIRRLHAWQQHHGTKIENLAMRTALPLNKEGAADVVIKEVRAAEELTGQKAVAVFIDTFKRNFSGDENASKDMGPFVAACDKIRMALPDSAIIPVHHSGHGNQERSMGSADLEAAVDISFRVEKDEVRNLIMLHNPLSRDSEPWENPKAFRFVTKEVGTTPDGKAIEGTTIDFVEHQTVNAVSKESETLQNLTAAPRKVARAFSVAMGESLATGGGMVVTREAVRAAYDNLLDAEGSKASASTRDQSFSRGIKQLEGAAMLQATQIKEKPAFCKVGMW